MGAQDEATFGLIPLVARGWARRGSRPVTIINHSNRCMNVFGARTKNTFVFSFKKKKRQREFIQFLEQLRVRWGRFVLFVDNAKAHTGKKTAAYVQQHRKVMKLKFFPKYTPEVNPVEQCWKPARQKLSNRLLKTLPSAQYHLRNVFCNNKSMPKMFQYLRD